MRIPIGLAVALVILSAAIGCGMVPAKWASAPGQTLLLEGLQQKGVIARSLYVVEASEEEGKMLDIDVQRSADDARREGGPALVADPLRYGNISILEASSEAHKRLPNNYWLVAKKLVEEQGILGLSAPPGTVLSLAFGVNPNETNVFQTFMNGLGMFLWGTTGRSSFVVSAVLRRPGEREIVASIEHLDARWGSGLLSLGVSFEPPYEQLAFEDLPKVEGAKPIWFSGQVDYLMALRAIADIRRQAGIPSVPEVEPVVIIDPADAADVVHGVEGVEGSSEPE